MLKRKIEKEIRHWIETGEKALLIYGVRQAGKTFIIRECLEVAGCDYIEFNLIRQPEIIDILDKARGIDDLILKLSLYSDKKIVPGKTKNRRRSLQGSNFLWTTSGFGILCPVPF